MRIGTIADIPNLMAYYTMGNAVGTVLPDETGNYPGTLVNGPATVPGRIGNALDFDPASTQYVDCGAAMGNAFGNGVSQLSVSLWFKADTTNIFRGMFNCGAFDGSDGEISVSFNLDNLRFKLSNATFNFGVSFTDTTNWHQVVAQYTGARGILYLDNSKVIDSAHSTNLNLTGLKTIIGGLYSVGGVFNGKIDQVRIYNGVLDAEQRSLFCNERPYPWVA